VSALASRISFINQAADRVLVVTNPAAGARSRDEAIGELIACLKDRGLGVEVVTDLSVFDALVQRYRAAGQLRAVVAAGGDGTVAEIVNRSEPEVPVTVYPLGTANLLASYFHLARDPVALAGTIVEGATARFDAGRANGRIFLSMVGCGFDGDVVSRLHRRRGGGHISYWTYARPIFEAIQNYRYPALRVWCESPLGAECVEATHSARWAFVVNLPDYAGGLRLAPGAVGTDGLLDVSLFERGSLWHGLKYLGFVKLGRHGVLSDCKMVRATRVRIESDEPVPYQVDGDPGGVLPLDIEVLPERLTLLARHSHLLDLGVRPAAQTSAGAR
jgi:diacylglycerol kinase (ATP)